MSYLEFAAQYFNFIYYVDLQILSTIDNPLLERENALLQRSFEVSGYVDQWV